MKLTLVILFVLLISMSSKADEFTRCLAKKESIQQYYELTKRQAKQRDVSEMINLLSNSIQTFCSTLPRSEYLAHLDSLKIEGQKNHLSFLRNEALYVSDFRQPRAEIEEMNEVYKKLQERGVEVEFPLKKSEQKELMEKGKARESKARSRCTKVDNRRAPLIYDSDERGQKNNMRDQDSIGWCYAHVAADLISHKIGEEVSAVDIAHAYNQKSLTRRFTSTPDSDIEGGFASKALERALERGLCKESDLPSDDFQFSKWGKDYVDELRVLEDLHKTYHENKDSDSSAEFKVSLQCNEISSDWNVLFPNLSVDDFFTIFHESSDSHSLIDELITKSCQERIRPKEDISLHSKYIGFFTGHDDLFDHIDEKLDEGKILGFSYDIGTLTDKYRYKESNHASTIVARRYNVVKRSCEYLVRGTYGSSCAGYDQSYICEEGNVWIPKEYIQRSTVRIDYVD